MDASTHISCVFLAVHVPVLSQETGRLKRRMSDTEMRAQLLFWKANICVLRPGWC